MTTDLNLPLDSDDWDINEWLRVSLEHRLAALHTAMPAQVLRYDADRQVADVRPMFEAEVPRRDGGFITEPHPDIPCVPVLLPRYGEFFVNFPIRPGDHVLLVFLERDATRWRVLGRAVDPGDRGMHELAYAVAIPGIFPRAQALTETSDTELVVGHQGGAKLRIGEDGVVTIDADTIRLGGAEASDAVSLETPTQEEIDKLWTALKAHVHSTSFGPTGLGEIPPSPPPPPVPPAQPIEGEAGPLGAEKVTAE